MGVILSAGKDKKIGTPVGERCTFSPMRLRWSCSGSAAHLKKVHTSLATWLMVAGVPIRNQENRNHQQHFFHLFLPTPPPNCHASFINVITNYFAIKLLKSFMCSKRVNLTNLAHWKHLKYATQHSKWIHSGLTLSATSHKEASFCHSLSEWWTDFDL